jgi:molybdate transport system regulatory protein
MMLIPKANFWAEIDGEVVLSEWRVHLLQAIDIAGSISGAAQQLDIPYKLAWERIHEMEARLGQPLVDAQVGGAGGGGATLTPLAREYVRRWNDFHQGLEALIAQRFAAAFRAEGS